MIQKQRKLGWKRRGGRYIHNSQRSRMSIGGSSRWRRWKRQIKDEIRQTIGDVQGDGIRAPKSQTLCIALSKICCDRHIGIAISIDVAQGRKWYIVHFRIAGVKYIRVTIIKDSTQVRTIRDLVIRRISVLSRSRHVST